MSQIACGKLKAISNHPNDFAFLGDVTLGSRLDGKLALVREKREGASDRAPEYAVLYCAIGQRSMRVMGNAWLKNSDKVNGGDFMSMTLDDPDWNSALNLTAFPPDKNGGDWRIIWSRPRGARVQDEQVAA